MSRDTGRKAKLLTLIFLLVSTISFCVSAPAASLPSVFARRGIISYPEGSARTHSLSPRQHQDYEDLLARYARDAVKVAQEETRFQSFEGQGPFMFGSHGFTGCIGIVIVSTKGAIIGHYESNDRGYKQAKDELPDFIEQHGSAFTETEAEAWVFAHVSPTNEDLFNNKEFKDGLVDLVKDHMGIDAKIEKYIEFEDLLKSSKSDDLREDYEELTDVAKYGMFVIDNEGGGSAPSYLTFVNVAWQRRDVWPELKRRRERTIQRN